MNKQAKVKNGVVVGRGIEEWRDVPGYEGYQVSNLGGVRSAWYPTRNGRKFDINKLKALRPNTRKGDGYQKLSLITTGGVKRDEYLHQLVLSAFVGDCPDGLEVRHLNGNKTDNSLENLLYGTPLENAQDRIRHGTSTRGEIHNTTKLSLDQVAQIKTRIADGEGDSFIAKDYPVSRNAIRSIRTGQSWGWQNE